MEDWSDARLIVALRSGDPAALDELYRRYSRKLHLFCRNGLRASDPEDLVHDVFLRVIERAGGFDPARGPFSAWLFGIARNRAFDLHRRRKRIAFASLEGGAGGDEEGTPPGNGPDGDDPDPGEEAVAAETAEAVRECIAAIERDEERQALVLYAMGGKLFREIGSLFGKSTSMAQKLVRAAKEKVKRCLERKGIEP